MVLELIGALFLVACAIVGLIVLLQDRKSIFAKVAYCDVCGSALQKTNWEAYHYNPHTGKADKWGRRIYCHGPTGTAKHYEAFESTQRNPYPDVEFLKDEARNDAQ